MPEISLTEFVDFIVKSGTPKLTEVKRIKREHIRGYHPARDYYRKLRDAIVHMHQTGKSVSVLDDLANAVMDKNKLEIYPGLIIAYRRFLGRKTPAWTDPPKRLWQFGDLKVRVNPELGLIIDGKKHFIKMYFKAKTLTKREIDVINHLMFSALGKACDQAVAGILDVRNSKLLEAERTNPNLTPLLQGEALSFSRMYDSV